MEKEDKHHALKRREFIRLTALYPGLLPLIGYLPALVSCSKGAAPEDIWLALAEALKSSPDHLNSRKNEAIQSKDVNQIFTFVRDQIITIPYPLGFNQYTRWGSEGIIRCGSGSPMEKAVLLKEMLDEAGFQSVLLQGNIDQNETPLKLFFEAHQSPDFDPDTGLLPKAKKNTQTDSYSIDNKAIASEWEQIETLLSALPEYPLPALESSLQRCGLIKLTDGTYLNPNIPQGESGKHYCTGEPEIVDNSLLTLPEVAIKIYARHALNPAIPQLLLEKTWPINKLIGKGLHLRFAPNIPYLQFVNQTLDANTVFIPTLSIENTAKSKNGAMEEVVLGKAITIHGKIIDTLSVNNSDNEGKANDTTKPVKLESGNIAAGLSVDATSFPEIVVHVKGSQLPAIEPGKSLQLSENGQHMNCLLSNVTQHKTHVLLTFDFSGSMPEGFRQKGAADMIRKLISNFNTKYPDQVVFKVMTMWFDYILPYPDDWTDDAELLASYLADSKPLAWGSPLWSLLNGSVHHPETNLVVFSTDGQFADDQEWVPDDYEKKLIGLGCPALLLAVGDTPDMVHLNDMAQATKGEVKQVEATTEAYHYIEQFIEQQSGTRYDLIYSAPLEGKKLREVRISYPGWPALEPVSYEIPENSKNNFSAWTSLYFELAYNGRSITRPIAGSLPEKSTVSEAFINDVHQAFFGEYTLSVEGNPPTLSQALNDIVSAMKANHLTLNELLGEQPEKGLKKLNAEGIYRPQKGLLEMATLPWALEHKKTTFVETVQMQWWTKRLSSEGMIEKIDILPFTQWRSINTDPKTAFLQTAKKSLQMAAFEAARFDTSTFSMLKNSSLTTDFDYNNLDKQLSKEARDIMIDTWEKTKQSKALSWQFRHLNLYPKNLSTITFWRVDLDSGTILGILPDGSGGGASSQAVNNINQATRGLQLLDWIVSFFNVFPAVAVWSKLEKLKMTYVAKSVMAIESMTTTTSLNEMMTDLASAIAGGIKDMGQDWLAGIADNPEMAEAVKGPASVIIDVLKDQLEHRIPNYP